MKRIALALWFLLPALCWGQIDLPETAPPYSVIKARCVTAGPAGGKIRCLWDSSTLSVVPSETGKLAYVTGAPGKHRLKLIVATATADSLELAVYSAEISIKVDSPTPTPTTLRELVDSDQAHKLSEFYRDFSTAVKTSPPNTLEQFRAVHDAMYALLEIEVPQLDAALENRLAQLTLDKLSEGLLAIADEFEQPGPPVPPLPPVEQGARRVVILHETEEDNTELGALWVKLRTGTPAKYLADNKHELLILDDDLDGEYSRLLRDKQGLPAVFILDPRTNAILFQATIPTGYTADNLVEAVRQTGG